MKKAICIVAAAFYLSACTSLSTMPYASADPASGPIRAGEYRFSVGTAGSGTLVFQTVLPALMLASEPSRVVIEGGTHNTAAPPFDFLARTFLPLLERMGPKVLLQFERYGFYPAGGGVFHEMATSFPRLYLAAGVTTVRTTGSIEPYTDIEIKRDIERSLVPGPKLWITGPYLEGDGRFMFGPR